MTRTRIGSRPSSAGGWHARSTFNGCTAETFSAWASASFSTWVVGSAAIFDTPGEQALGSTSTKSRWRRHGHAV